MMKLKASVTRSVSPHCNGANLRYETPATNNYDSKSNMRTDESSKCMSVNHAKTPKNNKKKLMKIKSMIIDPPEVSQKIVARASITEKQAHELNIIKNRSGISDDTVSNKSCIKSTISF